MKRFKIARPGVAHQTIEDEVVIVDLENGFYYSLTESGALIWDLLLKGFSQEGIVQELLLRTDGARAEIEQAIGSLLQELQKGQLITPYDGEIPQQKAAFGGPKVKFHAPKFLKFVDMQEALKLDPIHDVDPIHAVDPAGWPNPKR